MTQDRAYKFIDELTLANSILYKELDQVKQPHSTTDFNDLFNKLLINKAILNSGPDVISDYIQQILTWLKDTTPVRYSVSFKPRHEFVKKLYAWTKKNLQGAQLVEIEVTPEILGGVKISLNGKYYDFGLEKMVEQYFIDNKNAILSILQK